MRISLIVYFPRLTKDCLHKDQLAVISEKLTVKSSAVTEIQPFPFIFNKTPSGSLIQLCSRPHLARLVMSPADRVPTQTQRTTQFSITQWVPLCHYVCPHPRVHASCLIKMLGWKSRNYVCHLFMEDFNFRFQNSIF